MNRSIEDFILAEIEKHRASNIDEKLMQFNQICSRLGLEPQRINEMTPHLRKILKEEVEVKPYH